MSRHTCQAHVIYRVSPSPWLTLHWADDQQTTSWTRVSVRSRPPTFLNSHYKNDLVSSSVWWEVETNKTDLKAENPNSAAGCQMTTKCGPRRMQYLILTGVVLSISSDSLGFMRRFSPGSTCYAELSSYLRAWGAHKWGMPKGSSTFWSGLKLFLVRAWLPTIKWPCAAFCLGWKSVKYLHPTPQIKIETTAGLSTNSHPLRAESTRTKSLTPYTLDKERIHTRLPPDHVLKEREKSIPSGDYEFYTTQLLFCNKQI